MAAVQTLLPSHSPGHTASEPCSFSLHTPRDEALTSHQANPRWGLTVLRPEAWAVFRL